MAWGVLLTAWSSSCGSDDRKRVVEVGEGGDAGQTAASLPDAGGSSATAGGEAGSTTAGELGGAGGGPLGGAPSSDVPGAGAGGVSDVGGATEGGPSEVPGSPTCGPNAYDSGDGCAPCATPGESVALGCNDFVAPSLLANGGPLSISLPPPSYPREPLESTADVSYIWIDQPKQNANYPLLWNASGHWQIDVSSGPDDPLEVIVLPFVAHGACGDTFFLTEQLEFIRNGVDDYSLMCPLQ